MVTLGLMPSSVQKPAAPAVQVLNPVFQRATPAINPISLEPARSAIATYATQPVASIAKASQVAAQTNAAAAARLPSNAIATSPTVSPVVANAMIQPPPAGQPSAPAIVAATVVQPADAPAPPVLPGTATPAGARFASSSPTAPASPASSSQSEGPSPHDSALFYVAVGVTVLASVGVLAKHFRVI